MKDTQNLIQLFFVAHLVPSFWLESCKFNFFSGFEVRLVIEDYTSWWELIFDVGSGTPF